MPTTDNNAKRKYEILSSIIEQADRMEEASKEIKKECFRILHDNPGCDQERWVQLLLDECGDLLIDACGPHPQLISDKVRRLWSSHYTDPRTGLQKPLSTWAQVFATPDSVQLYDELT